MYAIHTCMHPPSLVLLSTCTRAIRTLARSHTPGAVWHSLRSSGANRRSLPDPLVPSWRASPRVLVDAKRCGMATVASGEAYVDSFCPCTQCQSRQEGGEDSLACAQVAAERFATAHAWFRHRARRWKKGHVRRCRADTDRQSADRPIWLASGQHLGKRLGRCRQMNIRRTSGQAQGVREKGGFFPAWAYARCACAALSGGGKRCWSNHRNVWVAVVLRFAAQ